jgi:hypothetical protein
LHSVLDENVTRQAAGTSPRFPTLHVMLLVLGIDVFQGIASKCAPESLHPVIDAALSTLKIIATTAELSCPHAVQKYQDAYSWWHDNHMLDRQPRRVIVFLHN